jgi:hypothetical protein
MLRARASEDVQIGEEVVARMVDRVLARASGEGGRPISEVINDSLYNERLRLRHAKDDEHAKTDRAFLARVRHELPHASAERQRALVRELVERYLDEITGHFDPRVYRFATSMLPYGLSGLMQGFSLRGLLGELRGSSRLDDHLLLEGEVKDLVRLAGRGTVILVPTHSSNLDSLLIGYAIYRMGLPHFVYGAGLNLFTNPLTSFFMHNLGAYTVDRSKTDPLYRETLKQYATVSLELGQHKPIGRDRVEDQARSPRDGACGSSQRLAPWQRAAIADLHRSMHHLVSARAGGGVARTRLSRGDRQVRVHRRRRRVQPDPALGRLPAWARRARSSRARPHRQRARSLR